LLTDWEISMILPQKLSLFRRDNGIYYIAYEEGGKRRWKSTGTKRKNKAITVLTNFQKLTTPQPIRRTLAEFIEEHKKYAKAIYANKTIQLYESSLSRFLSIVGNRHLTSYTERDVDFFKITRKEHVSVITVNVELRMLRAAFNTAKKWKYLDENPFKGVRFFQVPDKEPPYLSKDEFQKLINMISENWLKDVVITGAMTGMRRGEIINLRWNDVNLKTRTIVVQSSTRYRTKFGKRRVVPINDVVYRIFQNRWGKIPSEYVFTLNGRQISGDWFSHKLKDYMKKLDIPKKLNVHSLRHTFASWLVQSGVSIYEIQKLLGHSDIKVTQIYAHLAPNELHSVVSRIVF